MLSGELAPSSGSVDLGRRATSPRWSQPRRARAGVGRSYQRTTIFPEFSVLENCRLCAQAAHAAAVARCGRRRSTATPASRRRAQALAGRRPRPTRRAQTAGTLSHGGKRQLEIAMCLATRPQVLLLDEPLAGMGAEETDRMLALLGAAEAQPRGAAGRARHGRGVPHRRPHHRDGQRRGHRERRARAHPRQPRGAASPTSAKAH